MVWRSKLSTDMAQHRGSTVAAIGRQSPESQSFVPARPAARIEIESSLTESDTRNPESDRWMKDASWGKIDEADQKLTVTVWPWKVT